MHLEPLLVSAVLPAAAVRLRRHRTHSDPREILMNSHVARPLLLLLATSAVLATAAASADPSLIEQGRAALGRGETDAAIVLLEKAVAQIPRNAEAHYVLATAY